MRSGVVNIDSTLNSQHLTLHAVRTLFGGRGKPVPQKFIFSAREVIMYPAIRRGGPLANFRTMLDDFFNEPFFTTASEAGKAYWPRMDIVEDKERFLVRADLPGINKDDINVSIEGDMLTISGEKKEDGKKIADAYSHIERAFGSFSRTFTLPANIDRDNVEANYKNGVLELSLLKTGEEKKRAKSIEIK
ncbi:MAG: Hsp20/alpha crystallin family protein [Chitinispirillales bacterium]|nr:Hsp20/alpha crystallin family protein [Chitinispirillales bacterium]